MGSVKRAHKICSPTPHGPSGIPLPAGRFLLSDSPLPCTARRSAATILAVSRTGLSTMDDRELRQQICQAASHLWMHGLLAGEAGLIAAEYHRRRYLATPAGARRANLHPNRLIAIDLAGLGLEGDDDLPAERWASHRAAYESVLERPPASHDAGVITATVAVHPPSLLALTQRSDGPGPLELIGHPPVPQAKTDDKDALLDALGHSRCVLLDRRELFAVGRTLDTALSAVEHAEHAAKITFLAR